MKGIVKKATFCALFFVGGVCFVAGSMGLISNSNKLKDKRDEKAKFYDEYMLSDEFLSHIEGRKSLYKEGYEKGIFTLEEYDAKLKELLSDEYVEKSIIEGYNLEYIAKNKQLNEDIEKIENDAHVTFIPMIAGAGGFIGGASGFLAQRKKEEKANETQAEACIKE